MSFSMPKRNQESGFSVIEMVVALTVFAFSVNALTMLSNTSQRLQARAEGNLLAAELGQQVLMILATADLASPLLTDPIPNNYICFDTNSSCLSDHGTAADYNLLFQDWGAASANGSTLHVSAYDGVPTIWYEGHDYHVAWNVELNTPQVGARTITIFVMTAPFDGTNPLVADLFSWNTQLIRVPTGL